VDTHHLHTVQLDYYLSGSLDDASWAPIIQLDAAYTYYPTYAKVLNEYNRSNFLPVFMAEANYEYENNTGLDPSTPLVLRRQEYWTMLSGACGQLYGNRYLWPFLSGWQRYLDTPGSAQLGYLKALFEEQRWWTWYPIRGIPCSPPATEPSPPQALSAPMTTRRRPSPPTAPWGWRTCRRAEPSP